jgi:Transcriptional regulator, AbiEi antitoxin, Type IV TA system/Transcriptional regulator, AbiEi antitoxin N-terminal domain
VSTQNENKLKKLLDLHKAGTILLPGWLEAQGISRDLQKKYVKNGWLKAIGTGAYQRSGDPVTWQGALYTIQHQANRPVHAGALTALSLQGHAHFFRLASQTIFLFSTVKALLPKWFKTYKWEHPVRHIQTSFLPEQLALTELPDKNYSIKIATPERAVLECIYLAPEKLDLIECYHLIEGLSNIRPKVMQDLLEKCSSIKVKRLFLFMAARAQHQWLSYIDKSKIEVGKGARSIVKDGVYNAAFQITIPKELA